MSTVCYILFKSVGLLLRFTLTTLELNLVLEKAAVFEGEDDMTVDQ